MRAFDCAKHMEELTASGKIDAKVVAADGDNSSYGLSADGDPTKATATAAGPRLPREIKRSHVVPTNKIGAGAFGHV